MFSGRKGGEIDTEQAADRREDRPPGG